MTHDTQEQHPYAVFHSRHTALRPRSGCKCGDARPKTLRNVSKRALLPELDRSQAHVPTSLGSLISQFYAFEPPGGFPLPQVGDFAVGG